MSRSDRPILSAPILGALTLVLGLTLSTCGRRGPLDAPDALAVEQPADTQPEPQGRPIARVGQKPRLPIDFLLG